MGMFEKGESYSAINSARSALSTFLTNNLGQTVGSLPSVTRFLKGVFQLKPPKPRYYFIWDVNIVLLFLGNFYPNEEIPLEYLTYKLVTLFALITAQRAQTLHKIKLNQIIFGNNCAYITINDLLKHNKPGNLKNCYEIRRYSKDPKICVFEALRVYIDRTARLRNNVQQLFISFRKPHTPISKSTISRWIKKVLEEAGIDVDMFKAHSTRAAASSCAKRDGTNINEILKTAGWTNSLTFEKFYNKTIVMD